MYLSLENELASRKLILLLEKRIAIRKMYLL